MELLCCMLHCVGKRVLERRCCILEAIPEVIRFQGNPELGRVGSGPCSSAWLQNRNVARLRCMSAAFSAVHRHTAAAFSEQRTVLLHQELTHSPRYNKIYLIWTRPQNHKRLLFPIAQRSSFRGVEGLLSWSAFDLEIFVLPLWGNMSLYKLPTQSLNELSLSSLIRIVFLSQLSAVVF